MKKCSDDRTPPVTLSSADIVTSSPTSPDITHLSDLIHPPSSHRPFPQHFPQHHPHDIIISIHITHLSDGIQHGDADVEELTVVADIRIVAVRPTVAAERSYQIRHNRICAVRELVRHPSSCHGNQDGGESGEQEARHDAAVGRRRELVRCQVM